MDLDHRIIYDTNELIRTVETSLDSLKRFQYDSRYRSLLGDEFFNKLGAWDSSVRARMKDGLTLVVCGEFKRGKSSLINALLGEEVVTTNITPETVTVNRLSYGAHSNELVLSGGRRLLLKDEELQRDKLDAVLASVNEAVDQLELKRPIEILKHITIIDTPGLNDGLIDHQETVNRAIQNADAMIYAISVASPLSLSEQLFLRAVVLPQRYTDLFITANFSDYLRRDQIERVRAYLNEHLQALLPSQEAIMVSALDELCKIAGTDRPNPESAEELEQGFVFLRERLEQLIEAKRMVLIPDRLHRMTAGMTGELTAILDAIESGLLLDDREADEKAAAAQAAQAELQKQEMELQQTIEAAVQEMGVEARTWMHELLNRMQAELDTLNEISTADIKRFYSLFCVDTIQNALNRCTDQHTELIYDLLEENSVSAAKGLLTPNQDYGFRFTLDTKTWTKGDTLGYVASKFEQIPLLSLIVDGVAGAMRKKEIDDSAEKLIASIRSQYPMFRHSVDTAIDTIYRKMGEDAWAHLKAYFEARESEEQELSKQIMRAARQSAEEKAETRAAIAAIREKLLRLSELV